MEGLAIGYWGDQGSPGQLCMSVCVGWCVQEGLIQQWVWGLGLRGLCVLVHASNWGDWEPRDSYQADSIFAWLLERPMLSVHAHAHLFPTKEPLC